VTAVAARAAGLLGWRGVVSYGALRAPLALLELPLFVLLPTFYGEYLGVDLTVVGAILFLTRLVDAVADPAVGLLLDRHRARWSYRRWILWGLPALALGYSALFLPPAGVSYPAWLAIASVVTYIAYSFVSIAYQAWGAALGDTALERVRVTATREAFGLAGVLVSASLLLPQRAGWLVALFVASALLAAVALRRAPLPAAGACAGQSADASRASADASRPTSGAPRASSGASSGAPATQSWARQIAGTWRDVLANRAFRWLLAVFMLNGIATAIPATLVLFFVGDVLGAPERAPMFLVAYFLAAAVGMPLWVRLSRRFGLRNAWLVGMALAVFAFVWAMGLGTGDVVPFLFVCVVTGFALGADLAVPPALLATVLADEGSRAKGHDGAFFGIWNLATKLNLATAAGLALPILGLLGYVPGAGTGGSLALAATYAALPSALKLLAGIVLLLAPLPADDQFPDRTPSPSSSLP